MEMHIVSKALRNNVTFMQSVQSRTAYVYTLLFSNLESVRFYFVFINKYKYIFSEYIFFLLFEY